MLLLRSRNVGSGHLRKGMFVFLKHILKGQTDFYVFYFWRPVLALVFIIPVLKWRSDLNALISQLHRIIYTDTLKESLFVFFVWYQHCDSLYFIQIASLLFTWSVCPLNKQCCLTINWLFKYFFHNLNIVLYADVSGSLWKKALN